MEAFFIGMAVGLTCSIMGGFMLRFLTSSRDW